MVRLFGVLRVTVFLISIVGWSVAWIASCLEFLEVNASEAHSQVAGATLKLTEKTSARRSCGPP